jgi:hypothetical protein
MSDPDRHYITIWMRAEAEHDRISVADTQEIVNADWYDLSELPAPRHPYFDRLLAGVSMPAFDLNQLSESGFS